MENLGLDWLARRCRTQVGAVEQHIQSSLLAMGGDRCALDATGLDNISI